MWKKITVRSGFLSLSLFFSFFISCFLASSPSYALSDITYTLDSSHSFQQFCYQSACDGYKYILITSSEFFPGTSNTNVSFSIQAPLSSPNNYVSRYVSSLFLSPYQPVILPLNFDSFNRISVALDNASSWASVSVTVTLSDSLPSSCPPLPSGSITLTENGTFDVTGYAEAIVDVPPVIEPGDYHDDLLGVIQAIYVCAGVMLVLYFFYCIYRLIIRNSGVK